MKGIDIFYDRLEEPYKSCFFAIKAIILQANGTIKEAIKYQMPFFTYQGKNICYLWMDKKTARPYIGWVDGGLINHKALEQGNRKRMKILRIDPNKNLPKSLIIDILRQAIALRT